MKRVISVAVLVGAVVALVAALSLRTAGAMAAPPGARVLGSHAGSPACTAQWHVVPSPNASGFASSGLWGVAPVSASDVWAVGVSGDQKSGGHSLIEHWNGTTWQIMSNPNPGSFFNILYNVTAISANNVWAVGFYGNLTGGARTLVEHWNGTSWSVVPSPNPFHGVDHLEGVSAISSSDIWAVGTGGSSGQTLTEHWNGTTWSWVPSPSPGSGGDFRDVAAIAAGDVWAVGYIVPLSGDQTLAEHWNGTKWSVVASPNVGMYPSFSGVAAITSGDVWAVGYAFDSNFDFETLAEHWNGTSWSVVPSPNSSTGASQLIAVAGLSATDVWAVGHGVQVTLIEHYSCG